MLKGKFEIHEVVITGAIPKEIYLELPAKLVKYSLCIWGDVNSEIKKHNEEVLKSGQGVMIGSYKIKDTDIVICTTPDSRSTFILLKEDFIEQKRLS